MKSTRRGIFGEDPCTKVVASTENNKVRHTSSDKYHFYVFDRKLFSKYTKTLKRYSRCIQQIRVMRRSRSLMTETSTKVTNDGDVLFPMEIRIKQIIKIDL